MSEESRVVESAKRDVSEVESRARSSGSDNESAGPDVSEESRVVESAKRDVSEERVKKKRTK